MQTLGYVGYGILIFFAVTWTLGVRTKLDSGLHTILGALFYVVAAVLVDLLGVSKLHSWWLIPGGFAFVIICSIIISAQVPVLYPLIKFLGSSYAKLIRLGVPSQKIAAAQKQNGHSDADTPEA